MTTTEAALRDALAKIADDEGECADEAWRDAKSDTAKAYRRGRSDAALTIALLIRSMPVALSQPSPASSTLECGWCGLKYAEGQHFYDDTCNPCARQYGLEVPKDWKASPSSGEPASVAVEAERLGRFGHHPDAPIDYECEIDALIGMAYDRLTGMREHADLEDRIRKAMEFRVLSTPGELRWLSQRFNGTREIYAVEPECIAKLALSKPTPVEAGLREAEKRGGQRAIARIVSVSRAIGWQAGVGGRETAGAIVSYLATSPDEIAPFVAGELSPLDFAGDWMRGGCLTWHAANGKVVSPEEVAALSGTLPVEREEGQ